MNLILFGDSLFARWSRPQVTELESQLTDTLVTNCCTADHDVADVLIYCLELCIGLGVDHEEVIREKLQHTREKYPVEKVKGRSEDYFKSKSSTGAKAKASLAFF